MMDVLTFETCWALNNEIIKQVTSSWSLIIQLFVSLTSVDGVERRKVIEYWQGKQLDWFEVLL